MNSSSQLQEGARELIHNDIEQHELMGINNNLWMFSIFNFLNPLDLFLGIAKCCQHSKKLVEEYIHRKINTWQQYGMKDNTPITEEDLFWLSLSRIHQVDDEGLEQKQQEEQQISNLEAATPAEKDILYQFCFQQHVINTLKTLGKEWSREGLLQCTALNLENNDMMNPSPIANPNLQTQLLFENMMDQFKFYKSYLNFKIEEEPVDKTRKLFIQTNAKLVKCCILGSCSVGKTTFYRSLNVSKVSHHERYLATVGCIASVYNLSSPVLSQSSDASLNVSLWDLVGRNGNSFPRDVFIVGSKYCIIAFDLTKFEALRRAKDYIAHVRKLTPSCIILLVGMKSDSSPETKINNFELYNQLATYRVPYIEISSIQMEHNLIPLWFFFMMENILDSNNN